MREYIISLSHTQVRHLAKTHKVPDSDAVTDCHLNRWTADELDVFLESMALARSRSGPSDPGSAFCFSGGASKPNLTRSSASSALVKGQDWVKEAGIGEFDEVQR